jgi:endonuclease YncB( thermonuclease family)
MFFLTIAAAAATLIVPNGQTFSCTPTHVWDGDGPIWCAEGPRVRLAGIAAREIDETCRTNQPCPNVSALASRDALARLVGEPYNFGPDGHVLVTGPAMSCISTGSAGGKRTGAWCTSPTKGDISCAMVNNGYALRWDRYWGEHSCDQ